MERVETFEDIIKILGEPDKKLLLDFQNPKIHKNQLEIPGQNFVYNAFRDSNRNPQTLNNLQRLYSNGRLRETGYLSILPVDQDIEHSEQTFTPNINYLDPRNIINLAIESGCNAIASTIGTLSSCSRSYSHKIPFIVKLNHNENLTFPLKYDQIMFGSVNQAWNLGAAGIGATIGFGSKQSNRQIQEVSKAFEQAHELGMFTVLWCYLRNSSFKSSKSSDIDYHTSIDLTGQANHLGVTLNADLIKQKQPETCKPGFKDIYDAKKIIDDKTYDKLLSENPIDMCRYQVISCYSGLRGLINSGGGSGKNDLQQAVRTAVINKRAGGQGLILGRKGFQKPLKDGINLIQSVQNVYLCKDIGII